MCCTLSGEMMSEPVLAMDGHTYDRKNLDRWLEENSNLPPKPIIPLGEQPLYVPNLSLKRLMSQAQEDGGLIGLLALPATVLASVLRHLSGDEMLVLAHACTQLRQSMIAQHQIWNRRTASLGVPLHNMPLGCSAYKLFVLANKDRFKEQRHQSKKQLLQDHVRQFSGVLLECKRPAPPKRPSA